MNLFNELENESLIPKSQDEVSKMQFEEFRLIYKGRKRGLDTEFNNFKKKHKDYTEVAENLKELYRKQLNYNEYLRQRGDFVPNPANMQTYINNRRWEEVIPEYGEIVVCQKIKQVAQQILPKGELGTWDRKKEAIKLFKKHIGKFNKNQILKFDELLRENAKATVLEDFVYDIID